MKRFSLGIRSAKRGLRHEGVCKAQKYLSRFGYLRPGCESSVLDQETSRAIARYQHTLRLPVTGELDPKTITSIEAPRCGDSDRELLRVQSGDESGNESGSYVLRGCSFTKLTLTHLFLNGTDDIAGDGERIAVRNAFETWRSALCGMSFPEQASGSTDLRSGWFTGGHGDGFSFDGPGNVIAHAFYPPPCGGSHAGSMHFDDDENWNLTGIGGLDLETVALHEIGHLLGLAHSSDPSAIMYPTYTGVQRTLGQDDIGGIRRLYPVFCRWASSGNHGSGVSEIESANDPGSSNVVTASRENQRLRISSWMAEGTSIEQAGSLLSGSAAQIKIAKNPTDSRYVTACIGGSGQLVLIAWSITAAGPITRLGSASAGQVSIVDLAALSPNVFITAVRYHERLLLISWRLNANGSITRLAASGLYEEVTEISLSVLSSTRVATSIRASNGALKIVAWQVGLTTIGRLGDRSAGASSHIRSTVDAFGHLVTALRYKGELLLVVWKIESNGAVSRLGNSGSLSDEGTLGHDISTAFGQVVTSIRTSAGNLKTILWSTTSAGSVARTGDSAFLAGSADTINVSAQLYGPVVATAVRRPLTGQLLMLSWGLTAPTN